MAHGLLDEVHAQELIDQFVIKLRMVRHLRMQAYTDIFAGDPTWVTEAIGGRFNDFIPFLADSLQPRSVTRTKLDSSLES